jgi:hypothetical protein
MIDKTDYISYDKLMAKNPTEYDRVVNQWNQEVILYEHPTRGDSEQVLAVISNTAFYTGFYDTDSFYEGSEYNPILLKDGVAFYYEIM